MPTTTTSHRTMPPSAGGKEGPDAEATSEAPPPSESSTSLLGSIQSRWHQISDSQRISRLQQCQVLHDALAECRLRNDPQERPPRDARGSDMPQNAQNSAASDAQSREASSAAATAIETVPAGIRMLHYFQWRNLGEGNDNDNEGKGEEERAERTAVMRDAQRLCTREAHALWACRAVATACGPDLIRVRKCFDEHGPSILRHAAAYERQAPPSSDASPTKKSDKQRGSKDTAPSSSTPPCVDVQQALGSCVAEGIHSLNQRKGDHSK